MKYKYQWTFWIPILGFIRLYYILYKYKLAPEKKPYLKYRNEYFKYQVIISYVIFVTVYALIL